MFETHCAKMIFIDCPLDPLKTIYKIWETYILKLYYMVVSQNKQEMCLIQVYSPSQYNRFFVFWKNFRNIHCK